MLKLYFLQVHRLLLLGAHLLGTCKLTLVGGFLARPVFSDTFCKLSFHEEAAKVDCMQRFVTPVCGSGDVTH